MRLIAVEGRFSAFVLFAFALLSALSIAAEQKTAEVKNTKILLRAPLSNSQPPFAGTVQAVAADGTLKIAALKVDVSQQDQVGKPPAEGYYLGVVRGMHKAFNDATLIRVQVTEVSDEGNVAARIGRGLDGKIKPGKLILLVRPRQANTAQMKSLPDFVTIEKGPGPVASPVNQPKQTDQARMERSAHNLTEIAKAILHFEDSYGQLPPAFLVGPDGKPWHSWRVLIWGFIPGADKDAVFRKYQYDEPWDGPNNQKLLSSMPSVFTDQLPGGVAETFTRYAAVTGPGTVFSAEGFPFDGKKKAFGRGAGTRLNQIIDGNSNTLAVGTVSQDVQIPWMKPEDIVVAQKSLRVGDKGGFGAPYKFSGRSCGLFLAVSGQVHGVYDNIDPVDFYSMLTISDRNPLDLQQNHAIFIPQVSPAANGESTDSSPVIYIFEERGQVKARLAR